MKDQASFGESVNRQSSVRHDYSSLTARYSSVIASRMLIAWLALSPLASFYFRYPAERSLITFDRAALIFIAALFFLGWYRGTQAGNRFHQIAATKFELLWLILTTVALLSAVAISNNLGTATKTAIDAFLLPLVAFRLARYHLDLRDNRTILLTAAAFLSFVLFITGTYEMLTGVNLFPYSGSDIMREGEIRVNGPFSSDSSLAGISLLIALFLLAAPKVLRVRMDGSAQFIYLCSLISALIAALLPVFRIIAIALAIGWTGYEILRRQGRESSATRKLPNRSRRVQVLAGLAMIATLALSVMFISLLSPDRLTSLYNVYGRLATWTAAARIAAENPMTGVGLNNYGDYIAQRYETADQLADAVGEIRAARSPHSNTLWVATELGVAGLALYLAANLFVFLMGLRMLRNSETSHQRAAAASFLAIAAAYTIVGLTLTSGAYSDLNLCFFFLIGLLSKAVCDKTQS